MEFIKKKSTFICFLSLYLHFIPISQTPQMTVTCLHVKKKDSRLLKNGGCRPCVLNFTWPPSYLLCGVKCIEMWPLERLQIFLIRALCSTELSAQLHEFFIRLKMHSMRGSCKNRWMNPVGFAYTSTKQASTMGPRVSAVLIQ